MKTDIEIAQAASLQPIGRVAEKLGISEEDLDYYGKYKAKFSDSLFAKLLGHGRPKTRAFDRAQNKPSGV